LPNISAIAASRDSFRAPKQGAPAHSPHGLCASPKKLLLPSALCQVFFEKFFVLFYAWIYTRKPTYGRAYFKDLPLKIS
jgi:hypothetical protein